ncbi:MAG TPA: bifunctional 3,4-dihydroxy-2-butanone-4-phosphate synthase/GTP cyclohydrolase II [bacterium]|nr:bifunctional 3,4-dihydroxy-2-butanone-4-phosphate synthase/GTP cyclohydrolase II [bacterium]HOL47347.1 bifunctional 3,4-dihydroxy-2-butanone-4-phosphate synthase/GTP cyclohydrolase II [bacterium]HPQ17986.1 bifunctional 3,4-dihydroxy-2-butanone-4-phosphate synthase/GTP cyclohydrolase II [bacterium]
MIVKTEEAIKEIKSGRMIILVDDEDRENEGDLCIAAEFATPEIINFMTKYGRGLICLALTEEKVKKLELPMMTQNNQATFGTAFTVSIDARYGITTGISAYDRAKTIADVIKDDATKNDYVVPGHLFPLKAKDGGVLVRTGQTEGSVDLARLAGLKPYGVICEILNEDGTMARMNDLEKFAKEHNLKITTIRDLIEFRLRKEKLVRRVTEAELPTKFGHFKIIVYENIIDNSCHLALVKGKVNVDKPVLVRVHSQCFTGDLLSSLRCDCQNQLYTALELIAKEGNGILVYMAQEGRGIGLVNKIKAYSLQDKGYDTVEANEKLGFKADLRDYGIGAQILKDLEITKIKLLTNNPKKIIGLKGYDLEIVERIPLEPPINEYNKEYLITKKKKLGHLIENI